MEEIDDVSFGLLRDSNDQIGMITSVLHLAGEQASVRSTVQLRVTQEDSIVDCDHFLKRFAMNTKGQFARETPVDIHTVQVL